ncbi:hypothetical protein Tco_0583734 [Tanacetum coccineum]
MVVGTEAEQMKCLEEVGVLQNIYCNLKDWISLPLLKILDHGRVHFISILSTQDFNRNSRHDYILMLDENSGHASIDDGELCLCWSRILITQNKVNKVPDGFLTSTKGVSTANTRLVLPAQSQYCQGNLILLAEEVCTVKWSKLMI